jgi:MFS transporter, DHA3 family, macrolide efflux protein
MYKFFTNSGNRNFLRVWLAQLISQFGDRIHQLALVGLIAERAPGSTMGLAKLMAFTILPVFIIQPFAGVFVDRWDRRTTLFICDAARGILVLTIPFLFMHRESMIPIYIIVFLVFCFSRFYVPAKMSIIPDLIDKDHLLMANSLVTTTGMIAFALGCALGGYLIDRYGARNGFFIDAWTFFLSASIIFSMHISSRLKLNKNKILESGKEFIRKTRGSVWSEMKEGFLYLFKHEEIRLIINVLFILLSAAGSVYVVIIVFIQQAFDSVTKDLGILAVCLGAGLFLGAIFYGKFGKKISRHKIIFSSLLLGGLMLILFAILVYNYPNLVMAMVLVFCWGLAIGPIFIATNTIVHIVSDEQMRGKVFSALEIVIHFAFLIAMLASSWLTRYIDHVWILTGVGICISFVGGIGLMRRKGYYSGHPRML